jgi:uncharacterized membrane protein
MGNEILKMAKREQEFRHKNSPQVIHRITFIITLGMIFSFLIVLAGMLFAYTLIHI